MKILVQKKIFWIGYYILYFEYLSKVNNYLEIKINNDNPLIILLSI